MHRTFPQVLFPCFRLQIAIVRCLFGPKWWKKKKDFLILEIQAKEEQNERIKRKQLAMLEKQRQAAIRCLLIPSSSRGNTTSQEAQPHYCSSTSQEAQPIPQLSSILFFYPNSNPYRNPGHRRDMGFVDFYAFPQNRKYYDSKYPPTTADQLVQVIN
jgi:hypothetical protein